MYAVADYTHDDAAIDKVEASRPQSCNHVYEARPISRVNSAGSLCEPACIKCGFRPAHPAARNASLQGTIARYSDNAVLVTFASCRLASEFEKRMRAESFVYE